MTVRSLGLPARSVFLDRLADVLLLLVIPAAVFTASLVVHDRHLASDFRGTIWDPGRAVLHGHSPYPAPTAAGVDGQPSVYPPPLILAAVPISALPFPAAAAIWSVLLVAAAALALWLLDVRDWRCYFVAFASTVLWDSFVWGSATMLVLLAVAAAWHYRDRAVLAGAAAGAGVVVKLFPWPIIAWLALTRRLRAAAIATLGAATLAVISWAAIGFSGFSSYPHLLRELAKVQGPRGVSLFAILSAHGVGPTPATAIGLVVGGLMLAVAAVVARRPDGDRRASRSPSWPLWSRHPSSGRTTWRC